MARDTLFDRNEVTELRLHRRQFILGSRPVLINRDWKSVELSSELYLSSCSSLPVRITRDLDNVLWCLLGIAVESDPARSEPIEEISRAHTKEITQLYPTWAGRWVLIGNDELHMDAAGLLGCFYYVKEDLPRDALDVWVSSSPALFSHALGREHGKTAETRSLKSNINWYPPPMSGFLGVQRLLPSQVLSLPSGSTFARRLVAEVPEYKDYSHVLDVLQERLVTAVRRASRPYDTIWVPLSAGFDSRLVLAVALQAGLSVKTFTLKKEYEWQRSKLKRSVTSYTLRADMILPPLLAKEVGIEHHWVAKGSHSKAAQDLFDQHTGGHTIENDRVYFSHGQWDWTKKGDLFLRGHCFAVGKCPYRTLFPEKWPLGELPEHGELLRRFRLSTNSIQALGIVKWLDWTYSTPREKIDWRDRFYIEQRLAGWGSSLDQALDLVEGDRFYGVNSSYMYRLLLSVPEEKRIDKTHHIDLIRRMAPGLLSFPFNPPDPPLRRATIKILQRLRTVNSLPASAVIPYVLSRAKDRFFPLL